MTSTVPARPVALALLRRAQHVLFAARLFLGAVRTVADGRHVVAAIAGSAVLGAWYLGGVVVSRRSSDRRLARGWMLGLALGWTALSVLSMDFVWVAFPLFLLCLQMLPLTIALWSVAGLTAVTVAATALHRGRFDVPAALGPIIGAAVAIVITI